MPCWVLVGARLQDGCTPCYLYLLPNGRAWQRRDSRRDGQRELAAVVQSAGGFGRDEERWATRRVIESRGAAQEAGRETLSEIWGDGHGLRVQATHGEGGPPAAHRCSLLSRRAQTTHSAAAPRGAAIRWPAPRQASSLELSPGRPGPAPANPHARIVSAAVRRAANRTRPSTVSQAVGLCGGLAG